MLAYPARQRLLSQRGKLTASQNVIRGADKIAEMRGGGDRVACCCALRPKRMVATPDATVCADGEAGAPRGMSSSPRVAGIRGEKEQEPEMEIRV